LLAILFIVAMYPMIHFVATHFYLNANDQIYNYIPQESDIVIEINSRNFVREILYQKVFEEEYFIKTLFPPEEQLGKKPLNLDVGLNVFSKIIVLREQWAESDVWLAIVEYTDKVAMKKALERETRHSRIVFGDKYAIIQLNPLVQPEGLDQHLEKIAKGDIKSFSDRVNLNKYFDPYKEINVYLLHDAGTEYTQLIDGYLSYDFLPDKIDIEGEFTPVSGFETMPSIAYSMNDDVAVSIRSSISLFNSLYWFGKDRIDDLPHYEQMAFDYNGVHIFFVDTKLNYPFRSKQFPEMQVHFDLTDTDEWIEFISDLEARGEVRIDTTVDMLSTKLGTFFKYRLGGNEFELMRESTNFLPAEESNVYFDFRLEVDPILDNTKLATDDKNPPTDVEASIGFAIGNDFIADLRVMANMESMWYRMFLEDENIMKAEGEVLMKNQNGSSIIEILRFGSLTIELIKEL